MPSLRLPRRQGRRFLTDLHKEARLLLRDRKALIVAGIIPIAVIWAYSYVEPPAEVRFDEQIFRTTDPTALVISLAVMFPAFMMGAGAVVREKSGGTLDRLSRTPMNTVEFLGAKLLVLLAVSLVQVVLVYLVAMTTLDNITVQDSSGFLLRLALIALAFVATGLFVSSVAQSENQAVGLVTFAVLMMLVLSGFLAPLENLGTIEPLARILPYTHAYLSAYFFLKGLEPDAPYMMYLLIDTVVLLGLAGVAVHLYRRK